MKNLGPSKPLILVVPNKKWQLCMMCCCGTWHEMFYPMCMTRNILIRFPTNWTGAQVSIATKHDPQYQIPLSSRRVDTCPVHHRLQTADHCRSLWLQSLCCGSDDMQISSPAWSRRVWEAWSRHLMILSNSLDRNNKFDTDCKVFKSLSLRPLFLSSGRITACLNLHSSHTVTNSQIFFNITIQ